MKPVVRVVGLGPGDVDLLSERTLRLLRESPVVRLRTRVHPAASAVPDAESYDDHYERAPSFDVLYHEIADDLVRLAKESVNREVIYAVPGSPVVAERTVELLGLRDDVKVIREPAVSVIDVACAALGRDPMADGLRVVDALNGTEPFRGPGPLLVLQTYSSEILAVVGDRLPPETVVTILHHLGLRDERIVTVTAGQLTTFDAVDHLTSLWIDALRTAGDAMDDLVSLTRRLRLECPWDQEQTHASLTRHLLEEAYEALDALEHLVRSQAQGTSGADDAAHVAEELGDLLFQIVLHAELADEQDLFNVTIIADGVRDKLIGRHPHVFGDVRVRDSNEVAERWEALKLKEKGRDSITDGVAWQLPALTLYTKLLRKASTLNLGVTSAEAARARALDAVRSLSLDDDPAADAASSSNVSARWGDAVSALVQCAQWSGVDLEGVLRERARQLRDDIRSLEAPPRE